MTKIIVEEFNESVSDKSMPDRPAIPGVTPGQIGSITGVDRMDSLDRSRLPADHKLELLCAEARGVYGRDPRAGGFALVARPRVVLQLLQDMDVSTFSSVLRLQRPMVVGTSHGRRGETVGDSDIVGWWRDVPIAVRSTVVGDNVFVLPLDKIPPSLQIDRQQAGRMRMAAHSGKLATLREQ